jgi:hypothetical protein
MEKMEGDGSPGRPSSSGQQHIGGPGYEARNCRPKEGSRAELTDAGQEQEKHYGAEASDIRVTGQSHSCVRGSAPTRAAD